MLMPVERNASLEYNARHPEKLTRSQVDEFLDTLAAKMAEEKIRRFLGVVEETAKEVGNVTDPSKKGVEAYLEAVEKVQMDFDEYGNPQLPQLVVGSEETAKRLQEIRRQVMETPELRQRYNTIIDKKQDEWRDREITRNLVE
jgi:hypothetical protein